MDPNSPPLFFFNPDHPDLPSGKKAALGEKGKALVEMAGLGAPVPPGFILPARFCVEFFRTGGTLPQPALAEVKKGLQQLEVWSGNGFGDAKKPLLVSVRSSPPLQLPATFTTVFNVGLSEGAVNSLAGSDGDARLAWDAYRRFIAGYAVNVLGADPEPFQALLGEALEAAGAEGDNELDVQALEALARGYRGLCEEQRIIPPTDPFEQIALAIAAGFRAWAHPAAEAYRRSEGLEELAGAAMVVQVMAFGTEHAQSGAGSLFTRHPGTGERVPYGKFLPIAYGSDLRAGLRLPSEITELEKRSPEIYRELGDWAGKIERHFQAAQEIQFTITADGLKILRARPAERTARASLKIALDLVQEGAASPSKALAGIEPAVITELLHSTLDTSAAEAPLTKGMPASPGSAVGRVVFFAEHAEEFAAQGIKTILVRRQTTPEDIDGLHVAEGILTATGGLTSHAAVVARGLGKCCVVGAGAIEINYHINEMTIGEVTIKRRDWISLNGNTGEVFLGELPQVQPSLGGDLAKIIEWADATRTMGVQANADTPEDARRALEMGAEGIGLCRTEHMFFDIERIPTFRKMILAVDHVGRSAALAELLPLQRKDFLEILRVMDGRPVTIRLLDPPLHEFLPKGIRSQTRIAKSMNITVEQIQRRAELLSEINPMLGHRGCRLAVTYPEIYQMQVRAIVEAACIVTKEGIPVKPEIMVPLISTARELEFLRNQIQALVVRVMEELGESFPIPIGTMLETPRAAMCSESIARHADFYSFGTNDLTQMGFGFSRDDAGTFLPKYLESAILEQDPFISLDKEGIGAMMRLAIENGRKGNRDLKVGICGEHGGDARSVKFFHKLGLDYVSCSPFRIPVAKLAAAQAAVEEE